MRVLHDPINDITAIIQRTLDVAIYHQHDMEVHHLDDRCANAHKLLQHIGNAAINIIESGDCAPDVEDALGGLEEACKRASDAIAKAQQAVQNAHEDAQSD